MASSRALAADLCPNDEVLRTLLELYLALRCLSSPPESPIYAATEEAGRILRKNGIIFEEEKDGLKVSRRADEM